MVVSDHNNRFSSTPRFRNSFASRIFSDVAGDITVTVDDVSFLLHKFPLVSQCGKIRKMVAEAKDPNFSKLDLINLPGGPEAFELAAMFCYGMNFEITTANIAHLHCAAEYLEMTEDYRDENLITRTEAYLDEVVTPSLEKSVQVLCYCDTIADNSGIIDKCVDAIAKNACKERLVAGLCRLECDIDAKSRCLEWWIEDISCLKIDLYQRIISVMVSRGIRQDSVIASIMHYAQSSLNGIGKSQIWNPARTPVTVETGQRVIVETLVSLLPTGKGSSIPIDFLLGMLRMAIIVDSSFACRLAIERRIAVRLEMVSLDDLLIPCVQNGDSLFDVDTIRRILVRFLQIIEQEDDEDCGYESEGGMDSLTNQESLLKVGRLIDAYLAEIAPDPYLSFQKFVAMIEVLPDYARVIDDGLYRAVDIYLKAHPMLTEHEHKKICKFIDCEKLSQEACNHAAQNDRLPAHMAVRVLYFEQLRLKSAITGPSALSGYMSQNICSSGAPSAPMSPRDTYASLRRENRDLKLEISRMRVRLSDLEKEQVCMKQGMIDKTGNGKTFFTSISRKFGIFAGPTSGKQHNPGTGRK